jgi:hypothetical protein
MSSIEPFLLKRGVSFTVNSSSPFFVLYTSIASARKKRAEPPYAIFAELPFFVI